MDILSLSMNNILIYSKLCKLYLRVDCRQELGIL